MKKDLPFTDRYHGMNKRGHPTFRGIHNKYRVIVYYVLFAYSKMYRSGHGLTTNEMAEITGLSKMSLSSRMGRSLRLQFLIASPHIGGHCTRSYKIGARGLQWITNWQRFIPWAKYGLDEPGRKAIQEKIRALVDNRGYN